MIGGDLRIRSLEPAQTRLDALRATLGEDEHASLSPPLWPAGFFRRWTRREALVKALGTGLTVEMDALDVSLSPGAPAEMKAIRLPSARAEDWSLTHFDLADGFVGALATRGPARITLRDCTLPLVRQDQTASFEKRLPTSTIPNP
ncbi:4'-phosphopantetheinyl transferase superfamily protein [Tropicimonas sp. TH_r6]|uniref:4'-phosphopantetheinyl transferase family protein n=1 Tax=Tropicimonas sp. TH_r6 TaxID=3082085 RepID=UPI002955AE88|nr:4'-phosphopantetheinyl transferase superfamily protein [Tropicimonas sp. TH_r6]MDV7143122.1 4'-phosphopantetheinyl transferase superfamily protein [Tropicimonas sp. TH_r6]